MRVQERMRVQALRLSMHGPALVLQLLLLLLLLLLLALITMPMVRLGVGAPATCYSCCRRAVSLALRTRMSRQAGRHRASTRWLYKGKAKGGCKAKGEDWEHGHKGSSSNKRRRQGELQDKIKTLRWGRL